MTYWSHNFFTVWYVFDIFNRVISGGKTSL